MLSLGEWVVTGIVVVVVLLFPYAGRLGDALGRTLESLETRRARKSEDDGRNESTPR